jgi:hypothetical protein
VAGREGGEDVAPELPVPIALQLPLRPSGGEHLDPDERSYGEQAPPPATVPAIMYRT